MIKKSLIFILYATMFFFLGCSNPTHYLDEKIYNQLKNVCKVNNNSDMLVYYFDGDCSFCLAKVKAIENYLSDNKLNLLSVFIAKTMNPEIMKFNLNNLKVVSCVFLEKNNEFEKQLTFNKITKINRDRGVFDFDNKFNLDL